MTVQADWGCQGGDAQRRARVGRDVVPRDGNTLPAASHGAHAWLYGTGTELDPLKDRALTYFNYTYGQWAQARLPPARPGHPGRRAATSVRHVWGARSSSTRSPSRP